jgi:hypothetical protein
VPRHAGPHPGRWQHRADDPRSGHLASLTGRAGGAEAERVLTLTVVERRRDGKLHPAGGRLGEREHDRALTLAHILRCCDGLSYRQVRAALEQYGIRRSLGQVFADVRDYECDHCAPGLRPTSPAGAGISN